MPPKVSLYRIEKAFYHAGFDLVVLTGSVSQGRLEPGMWIDLPKEVGGPGRVPIQSVEYVEFLTGRELAVTVNYQDLSNAAFDPAVLEGSEVEVVG